MKRILCMLCIILFCAQLAGCAIMERGIQSLREWYGVQPPEIEPETPVAKPEDDAGNDIKTDAEQFYTFTSEPFETFGEERLSEYSGWEYKDMFDYGEPVHEDAQNKELHIAMRRLEKGEFLGFLQEYCLGSDPVVSIMAVVIDGERQPYYMLRIQMDYPDYDYDNEQERARHEYMCDYDMELILLNCEREIIAAGYRSIYFSLRKDGETNDIHVIREENGTFL